MWIYMEEFLTSAPDGAKWSDAGSYCLFPQQKIL